MKSDAVSGPAKPTSVTLLPLPKSVSVSLPTKLMSKIRNTIEAVGADVDLVMIGLTEVVDRVGTGREELSVQYWTRRIFQCT